MGWQWWHRCQLCRRNVAGPPLRPCPLRITRRYQPPPPRRTARSPLHRYSLNNQPRSLPHWSLPHRSLRPLRSHLQLRPTTPRLVLTTLMLTASTSTWTPENWNPSTHSLFPREPITLLGVQQLIASAKLVLAGTLSRCDDSPHGTLDSLRWSPGWITPLHRCFSGEQSRQAPTPRCPVLTTTFLNRCAITFGKRTLLDRLPFACYYVC